jgi:hypothetical protein
MKSFNKTMVAAGAIAGLGAVMIAATPQKASAANDVKPSLSANGMDYYAKPTAKTSAIGRWERKASAKHGAEYGGWGKAKQKSVNCNSRYHQGNGKKLWTCTARGKPVAKVQTCKKGFVTAIGVKPEQKDAVKWAHRFWARGAADMYGVAYSFHKNAKNRSMHCSNKGSMRKCVFKAIPCK